MSDGRKGSIYSTLILLSIVVVSLTVFVYASIFSTTINSPSNEQIKITGDQDAETVDFNFSFVFGGGASQMQNVSLWWNVSGTFEANATIDDADPGTAGFQEFEQNIIYNISLNVSESTSFETMILFGFQLNSTNFASGLTDENFTSNFTFIFDQKAPAAFNLENGSVGATLLQNGTVTANQTPTLNYTTTSDLSFHNITLFIWTSQVFDTDNPFMNLSVLSSGEGSFDLGALGQNLSTDTRYYYSIIAYDNATHLTNATEASSGGDVMEFIVDVTVPVVTLSTPLNNTWLTTSAQLFNFSWVEGNPAACSLWITNQTQGATELNITNSSLASGDVYNLTEIPDLSDTPYNFTGVGVERGGYLWSVECNDSADQSVYATQGNFTLLIDATTPLAAQLGNFTTVNGTDPLFNGTVSSDPSPAVLWDAGSDLNFINYTVQVAAADTGFAVILDERAVGDVENQTGEAGNTSINYSSTGGVGLSLADVGDGEYYVRVLTYDIVSSNTSYTSEDKEVSFLSYILDTKAPNVTLSNGTTPLNASWQTSNTVQFNFTLGELHPENCTFYISDQSGANFEINISNDTLREGDISGVTWVGLADTPTGTPGYLWSWECKDNASNFNFADEGNFTLLLDANPPTAFDLGNFTPNLTITNDNAPAFNWTETVDLNFLYYNFTIYSSTTFTDANIAFQKTLGENSTVGTDGNVTNTSIDLSEYSTTLSDGTYFWYTTAYDPANEGKNSTGDGSGADAFFQFQVDTKLPNVTFSNGTVPFNATFQTSSVVLFNFTLGELNPENCSFYLSDQYGANWEINVSNDTSAEGDIGIVTYDTLSDTPVTQGYLWNVECKDNASNLNFADEGNFTLLIDANAPTAFELDNLTANDTKTTDTSPGFNWSATTELNFLYYNFTIYNTAPFSESNIQFRRLIGNNATNGIVGDVANVSINLSDYGVTLPDGVYYWHVTAADIITDAHARNSTGDGSSADAYFQFTVDVEKPTVVLNGTNGTFFTQNTEVYLNATVNDTNIETCLMYVTGGDNANFRANVTNSSMSSPVEIYNNISDQPDGTYSWYYECNDTSGNLAYADNNLTYIIDTNIPGVVLDNTTVNLTSDTTPDVNWSTSEELYFLNYTIRMYLDAGLTDLAFTTSTSTANDNSTTVSGLTLNNSNVYYWQVLTYDQAGQLNTSDIGVIEVDNSTPVTALSSPTDVQWITSSSQSFSATVEDNNTASCSLYTDMNSSTFEAWSFNDSFSDTDGVQTVVFASIELANKTSGNWNVICNDSLGQETFATANFTLNVDTGLPVLSTEQNSTTTASREVSFNVTDVPASMSGVNRTMINISLGSSSFNQSIHCTDISNGFSCSYLETGLLSGANNLQFSVEDNASNVLADTIVITLSGVSTSLSLSSGWNLITTPVILTNSSIDALVADNDNVQYMYYYNDSLGSWQTWRYTGSDSLTTLEPRRAYWVNATAATTLTFSGLYTRDTGGGGVEPAEELNVSVGWNLIGHYRSDGGSGLSTDTQINMLCGHTAGRLCSENDKRFDALYYFDASGQALIPSNVTDYDVDQMWTTGRGFWIYMTTADTYGP